MFKAIDNMIDKLSGEYSSLSNFESIEIIFQNILTHAKSENILLIGNVAEEVMETIIEVLNKKSEELNFSYGINPNSSVETIKKIGKSEEIVLVVERNRSNIVETNEIIAICQNNKKPIIGYIML